MKPGIDDAKDAGLRNILGTVINPATEDTLQTLIGLNLPTSIVGGRKIVTTAGTAEKLIASTTSAKKIIITALEANTGMVVVGGSSVVASSGTRNGIPLTPLSSIELTIDDISKIYLDVTVNGEGVSFVYFN